METKAAKAAAKAVDQAGAAEDAKAQAKKQSEVAESLNVSRRKKLDAHYVANEPLDFKTMYYLSEEETTKIPHDPLNRWTTRSVERPLDISQMQYYGYVFGKLEGDAKHVVCVAHDHKKNGQCLEVISTGVGPSNQITHIRRLHPELLARNDRCSTAHKIHPLTLKKIKLQSKDEPVAHPIGAPAPLARATGSMPGYLRKEINITRSIGTFLENVGKYV